MLSHRCIVIASTMVIGEFLYIVFLCDRSPLWLPTISVDCLCIVLYDMLYIYTEPWSSQNIMKWQIMYACMYVCMNVCMYACIYDFFLFKVQKSIARWIWYWGSTTYTNVHNVISQNTWILINSAFRTKNLALVYKNKLKKNPQQQQQQQHKIRKNGAMNC